MLVKPGPRQSGPQLKTTLCGLTKPYGHGTTRVACLTWLPISTYSIEAAAITLGSDMVFRSEVSDLRYDLVGRGIRSFVLAAARATVIADGQARKSPPN